MMHVYARGVCVCVECVSVYTRMVIDILLVPHVNILDFDNHIVENFGHHASVRGVGNCRASSLKQLVLLPLHFS